jgi:hypothetical protein
MFDHCGAVIKWKVDDRRLSVRMARTSIEQSLNATFLGCFILSTMDSTHLTVRTRALATRAQLRLPRVGRPIPFALETLTEIIIGFDVDGTIYQCSSTNG